MHLHLLRSLFDLSIFDFVLFFQAPECQAIWEQIQKWFALAREDKRFLIAADPPQAVAHRIRAKTFIIPQHCHLGEGKVVWDHRPLDETCSGRPAVLPL